MTRLRFKMLNQYNPHIVMSNTAGGTMYVKYRDYKTFLSGNVKKM